MLYVCRHKYVCMNLCIYVYVYPDVCICHKGVVFWTKKSNVHAQGASLQTTEKTSNEAFLDNLFRKSDLQKMFLQFTPQVRK